MLEFEKLLGKFEKFKIDVSQIFWYAFSRMKLAYPKVCSKMFTRIITDRFVLAKAK